MNVNRAAPAVAFREAWIDAPPQVVWATLSALHEWPQWNEAVSRIELRGPIAVGTEFRWVAGGTPIVSRLEVLEPPRCIVWSGRARGIRAIHRWELHPERNGTKVRTGESFEGLLVRLFARRMRTALDAGLTQGLGALKREAERRSARVAAPTG